MTENATTNKEPGVYPGKDFSYFVCPYCNNTTKVTMKTIRQPVMELRVDKTGENDANGSINKGTEREKQ